MNNKITFPRLATMLADQSGRSKRFSEDFLREFFSLISETLEAHESVKIKGLGTFRLTKVEPRRSVDVTTGEPMEISGHSKVVFIPSKELAEAVNSPFEAFSAIEISDDADIDSLFLNEDIALSTESEDNNVLDVKTVVQEPALTPILEEQVVEGQSTQEDLKVSEDSPILEETSISEATQTADEQNNDNADDIVAAADVFESTSAVESNAPDESNASDENIASDKNIIEEESIAGEETQDDSEVQEEEEDVEEEFANRRKRRWPKILMVSLAASIVALIAILAVWYFFAHDHFDRIMRPYIEMAAGKKSGNDIEQEPGNLAQTIEMPDAIADTLADSSKEESKEAESLETESDVPTAPSDAIVYDTISTTRYLTTMAKAHYGNYNLWPYIYQENSSFLGHPDRIRPGTPVVIPKLSKYGVDPTRSEDIEKAKKLGVEIYARYGKKI